MRSGENSPPATLGKTGPPRSAITDVAAHLRLWTIAVTALGLDLWSKHWVFHNLGPSDVRVLIPNLLTLRRSLNSGALFGLGKGMVPLFIVASLVALAFVLYLFACSHRRQRVLHLALSLVLAGSLGNLYDRVFVVVDSVVVRGDGDRDEVFLGKIVRLDEEAGIAYIGQAPEGEDVRPFRLNDIEVRPIGVVRDFLKFEPAVAGRDVWPWIFNVADSLLVVGVGILLLSFWVEQRQRHRSQAEATNAAS